MGQRQSQENFLVGEEGLEGKGATKSGSLVCGRSCLFPPVAVAISPGAGVPVAVPWQENEAGVGARDWDLGGLEVFDIWTH